MTRELTDADHGLALEVPEVCRTLQTNGTGNILSDNDIGAFLGGILNQP